MTSVLHQEQTLRSAAEPRIREAVRLLWDRQLPHGGWNYGNTVVLKQELRPHLLPTGLARIWPWRAKPAPPIARDDHWRTSSTSWRSDRRHIIGLRRAGARRVWSPAVRRRLVAAVCHREDIAALRHSVGDGGIVALAGRPEMAHFLSARAEEAPA